MAATKPQPPAALLNSKSPPKGASKAPGKPPLALKKTLNNTMTTRKMAISPQKPVKPCKPIFKGKSICFVGTYKRAGKQIPNTSQEDLCKYVRLHGGQYVREVTDTTTHLVCSLDEFMKDGVKNVQIERAIRLGKRRCHIVLYDWFEDCLVGSGGKKSLKYEKPYTLDRVMIRLAKGLDLTPEYFSQFSEGVKAAEELVDNKLYHIHYDADGFEYKVILSRVQMGSSETSLKWEKYTLYLFESHAIPHVFMVGAKFSRLHKKPSLWRDYCQPMSFSDAFKHFQHFFLEKTGVHWDMRLEPLPDNRKLVALPLPKKRGKKGDQVDMLAVQAPVMSIEDMRFRYTRPPFGQPVGLLPFGYVKEEDREGFVMPADQREEESSDDASDEGGARLGHAFSKPALNAYDSDSEVEEGVDGASRSELGSRSGSENSSSRGRSASHPPSQSTHFSTIRSSSASSSADSGKYTQRSRSSSTSTRRNENPWLSSRGSSRNGSESGSGADVPSSPSSASHAPTHSTHFSTIHSSSSNSDNASDAGSYRSSMSVTPTPASRQASGQRGGSSSFNAIEISDSSDGEMCTTSFAQNQFQGNGSSQSFYSQAPAPVQASSNTQPQRNQNQVQPMNLDFEPYDNDEVFFEPPNMASFRNFQENDTRQQWSQYDAAHQDPRTIPSDSSGRVSESGAEGSGSGTPGGGRGNMGGWAGGWML